MTTSTASKIVDFQPVNNLAFDLAKASKSADKTLTKVNAKDITKIEPTVQATELDQRMESSAKIYIRIKSAQKKHLSELRSVGSTLNEYRSLHSSDKAFGQAIAKTPLKVVSRQDRTDLMWLDSNWDSLQELITKGDLTSRNPAGLRQQLAKLNKVKSQSDSQSKTESTDEDSAQTESTTQQSSKTSTKSDAPSQPTLTEQSVAEDLIKLLKANPDLDFDLIIDQVRDAL